MRRRNDSVRHLRDGQFLNDRNATCAHGVHPRVLESVRALERVTVLSVDRSDRVERLNGVLVRQVLAFVRRSVPRDLV